MTPAQTAAFEDQRWPVDDDSYLYVTEGDIYFCRGEWEGGEPKKLRMLSEFEESFVLAGYSAALAGQEGRDKALLVEAYRQLSYTRDIVANESKHCGELADNLLSRLRAAGYGEG